MTTRVVGEHEVSLNAVRFPLVGKVRSSIASTYPEKRVEGDFTRDSQRNVSVVSWSDQSGGIGHRTSRPGVFNRAWASLLNLRHANHLTLPALETKTAAGGAGNALISELGGKIIAAYGTDVREYDEGGNSWGSALVTLGATPTDVANGALTTTEFLVFAIGTGYEYSSSSATWASSTKDALNIVFHDDRFWGIDATGQLWYTFTMGSAEVNDALLPLDASDAVTGLFTGREPGGGAAIILYVSTKKALWAHDVGNRKFVKTSVFLAGNAGDAAERVSITWRDRVYLGSGAGINEWTTGNPAVFRPMGFNEPDGTPGSAALLIKTEQTVASMASSVMDLIVGGNGISNDDFAFIYAWNGVGWQQVWDSPGSNSSIYSMHVSDSGGTYRLWFTTTDDDRVYFLRIPVSGTPVTEVADWTYSSTSVALGSFHAHEYPIFTADQKEITKIALVLRVEVKNAVANTVGVQVYVSIDEAAYVLRTETHTNDSTFFADQDFIVGDGVTNFSFPSVATPAGTAFKSIQIRVDLRRGSTATQSPDVISVTLEYLKVLDEKLGFDFELDFTKPFGGRSPKQLRAAYATAQTSKILVELTYRDDDGGSRNYYVKVLGGQGDELTGHEERGTQLVRCQQP